MSRVRVASSKLTALANAIRAKSGRADDLSLDEALDIIPTLSNVPVESISVIPTALELKVDNTQQLSVTILPADATNKDVEYISSNTEVAIVSNTGLVTIVGVGTATVTVRALDGSGAQATCNVTGTPKFVPVQSLTVAESGTTVTLGKSRTQQLTVTVTPSDATNPSVQYTSNNTSVATVSNAGLITAVGLGTAVITVKTLDGSNITRTVNVSCEMVAGTYDANDNLLKTWDELIADKDLTIRASSRLGDGAKMISTSAASGDASAFTDVKKIIMLSDPDIRHIGGTAFRSCVNIETFILPDKLEYIDQMAFWGCTGMTSITIPSSVKYIIDTRSKEAFRGCSNLTTIYYKGTASGAPWGATNATVITSF